MAEYINRAELIENLNKFAPEHYNALINQIITKQPVADVVEVVRCKDCILFKHIVNDCGICQHRSNVGLRVATEFCSYGKREKTGNEN